MHITRALVCVCVWETRTQRDKKISGEHNGESYPRRTSGGQADEAKAVWKGRWRASPAGGERGSCRWSMYRQLARTQSDESGEGEGGRDKTRLSVQCPHTLALGTVGEGTTAGMFSINSETLDTYTPARRDKTELHPYKSNHISHLNNDLHRKTSWLMPLNEAEQLSTRTKSQIQSTLKLYLANEFKMLHSTPVSIQFVKSLHL